MDARQRFRDRPLIAADLQAQEMLARGIVDAFGEMQEIALLLSESRQE